ncbi:MAG: hypothetical protein F6J98_01875 [Moorea sp. SIO4G2]|nr:hypothetical protein [Moorena sp. SIO4G2]
MGIGQRRYRTARNVGTYETSQSQQQTVNHNQSKNTQKSGLYFVKEYENILDQIEKIVASAAAMLGLTVGKLTLSVGIRLVAMTIFFVFSTVVSIDSFYQINGGISLIPCPVRDEPWIGWGIAGLLKINLARLLYSAIQTLVFNAAQSIFLLIQTSSRLVSNWPVGQRKLLWVSGLSLSACEAIWVFADRWPLDVYWIPGLKIGDKVAMSIAWTGWNVYVVFAIAIGASLFGLTKLTAESELGYTKK